MATISKMYIIFQMFQHNFSLYIHTIDFRTEFIMKIFVYPCVVPFRGECGCMRQKWCFV